MPQFRAVEFPDILAGDGSVLKVHEMLPGQLRFAAILSGTPTLSRSVLLTPEQQDELWLRIGEARGHLPPASDTPKPWRDLGGEG